MAMFRDFSFDQASRHPSPDAAALNVSPTTMISADQHCSHILPARERTPPPCSIGDLAHQLGQHKLSVQVEVDPQYQFATCEPPTPSEDSAIPTEPLGRTHRSTYSRVSTSILRMQRQANTRMQCNSSHVRDISRLVQRMVEVEDQCVVSEPKSRTSSTSSTATTTSSATSSSTSSSASDEDEAISMDYTSHAPADEPFYRLSFRRSGEPMPGCAMINKGVRMRTRRPSKVLKRRPR